MPAGANASAGFSLLPARILTGQVVYWIHG